MNPVHIHLLHMRDILQEMRLSMHDDLTVAKNKRNIERCLEVLGEAARRIPVEIHARHPEIPWKQIIGTRNVITHDYEKISPAKLREIVQDNAVLLIPSIETLMTMYREE
jgi:uncharacterized protein with HEPN domain